MRQDRREGIGVTTLVLLALVFIAAVMASNTLLSGMRIDLTENNLYTLSDGTLSLLEGIEEPITLYYFFSDRETEDIQYLRSYATRVREMLEEFVANAGGRLILNEIDPLPFSEDEDRASLFGLEAVPISGLAEPIYFGVAGTNSVGDEQAIPFLQPAQENFLEYDLAKLVYSLANPDRVVVGMITGIPITGGFDPLTQRPSQPWVISQQVEQLFETRPLPASVDQVDEDIDVLWVVHPTALDEMTQYAIDQFVLRGGRLLAFVDPLAEVAASAQAPAGINPGSSSTLGPLFDAWGIEFSPAQAVADDRYALSVNAGGVRPMRHIGLVGLDAAAIDDGDVVTAGLESVNLGVAGHLALAEESGLTLTPLLSSSAEAATMTSDRFQMLGDPSQLLDGFSPTGETYVLAGRLQGSIETAFPDGPPGEFEPTETFIERQIHSTDDANMIIVADVDILSDRLWARRQSFLGQELISAFANNGDFVINALDNLSGSADLIGLRSRASFTRPFEKVEELRREADARFRETEQQLQAELDETERRLAELQASREDSGSLLMSPEQEAEVDRFLAEQLRIRRELRAVRRELDSSIEQLGTNLKIINILGVPLLLVALSLLVAAFRQRRKSSIRGRNE